MNIDHLLGVLMHSPDGVHVAAAHAAVTAEVERLRAIETRAKFIVENPAPHVPSDAAIRRSMRYVLLGEG